VGGQAAASPRRLNIQIMDFSFEANNGPLFMIIAQPSSGGDRSFGFWSPEFRLIPTIPLYWDASLRMIV
jgi:hypothetical protein